MNVPIFNTQTAYAIKPEHIKQMLIVTPDGHDVRFSDIHQNHLFYAPTIVKFTNTIQTIGFDFNMCGYQLIMQSARVADEIHLNFAGLEPEITEEDISGVVEQIGAQRLNIALSFPFDDDLKKLGEREEQLIDLETSSSSDEGGESESDSDSDSGSGSGSYSDNSADSIDQFIGVRRVRRNIRPQIRSKEFRESLKILRSMFLKSLYVKYKCKLDLDTVPPDYTIEWDVVYDEKRKNLYISALYVIILDIIERLTTNDTRVTHYTKYVIQPKNIFA